MRRLFPTLGAILACSAFTAPVSAREVVTASAPQAVSVTVYRDPNRGDGAMNLNWLNGFALISETRTVILPRGETTIRFDGVAESMVAVSAIVTGLPGGAIEKNRNTDILSPAALVDGTLGNRVTITRTNPATGEERSEDAVVRTRADGGLVLQTRAGYEAVRCAGIPERLTFNSVPEGLSPNPVYTVDTRSEAGGTYTVQLTYLASGFDWNAHYVATFAKAGQARERKLRLAAWLTVANSNGQSFPSAELLAVAGRLEVRSNYRSLSQPPRGRALRLTCYPLGSTARGNPEDDNFPPSPAPPAMMAQSPIMVTAQRKSEFELADAVAESGAVMAVEEALGDLKLYRVPMAVTVAAKAQKQVAFLELDDVEGHLMHRASCTPDQGPGEQLANIVMRSRNLEKNGLGRALPAGGVTLFEPSAYGPLLISEDMVRDHAIGQEVEFAVADHSRVKVTCGLGRGENPDDFGLDDGEWHAREAVITNDSTGTVEIEVRLGPASRWKIRKASKKVAIQDGVQVLRIDVPARGTKTLRWQVRDAARAEAEQPSTLPGSPAIS